MARTHEDLDERLLHRLLFFTDAVFAIVMTLLVLELRPPEGDFSSLRPMLGKFVAFGMSFSILGIFWIAHLSTTRRLRQFDWPTAVANLVFLLPVCLIPFVSAWIGAATEGPWAWSAYSLVLIATSAANMALVVAETREGGRLLAGGITGAERLYRVARAACPGLAFAVGFFTLQAGQTRLAQFCWVLIPLFLVLFRLTLKPKPAPEPA